MNSGPDGQFILHYLANHGGIATQKELKAYLDCDWFEYFDCRDALIEEDKIKIGSYGPEGTIHLL